MTWLFLNQMQGITPHPDLSYELYQGGSLVRSGDLVGAGDPWGGPSQFSIPVAPGAYTLKVSYDKYYVAGTGALATLSATFDTQAADKDPPALLALNVLSGGGPTDSVPPTASGQVRVTFTEVLAVLPGLKYSTGGGTTWNALAVTDLGSGDYTATLPTLPNDSTVSLRIEAEDAAGNSLDYRMVPTFSVGLSAPVLLSPTNGFATDQHDITFRWEAVQTPTAYYIQIDTGDTFNSPNLIEATVTGDTEYTATLAAKGVYYWRVRARDSQLNVSPWSAVWRLTIADPVVQVTTYPGGDYDPAIMEAADRRLWVVWWTCRSQCRIWYKTGDDGGLTWSGGTKLTLQSYNDYRPSIAQTTGGRIWVAWDSWRNTNPAGVWNYDIFYKTSDDNGVTWSADTLLTTDTGDDYAPSITQTVDGKIWLVWYSYRSGNSDIWYKTSDDGGATWSAAIQLTTDTSGDFVPSITQMADGKIWVVWTSLFRSSNLFNLWYKTSDDGGATWSAATQLTTGFIDGLSPIAQTTDGRIWVAWSSWRNTNPAGVSNYDIYYKTSDDNGATWSQDTLFTRFVGYDFPTDITALSSGYLALVWYSNRPGNDDIWYGIIGQLEDVNPPPYVQSVT